ncbi:hypothetical protein RRG08_060999 [Elysia crispata]|uniref:Uncharacterized protein n=1 Tax=Elysia crispata TaxID=231223 RepID=A0AAE1AV91_9GAST|nr:hypothetical protein RRG08_060999 [Elysia crispata]
MKLLQVVTKLDRSRVEIRADTIRHVRVTSAALSCLFKGRVQDKQRLGMSLSYTASRGQISPVTVAAVWASAVAVPALQAWITSIDVGPCLACLILFLGVGFPAAVNLTVQYVCPTPGKDLSQSFGVQS